jgi:phage shock protein A
MSREDELALLKEQAATLKEDLGAIEQRIENMEAGHSAG